MLKKNIKYLKKDGLIKIIYKEKFSQQNEFNKKYYNKLSHIYDFAVNNLVIPLFFRSNKKLHYQLIEELISPFKDKRILEVACGSGSTIKFIDSRNYYAGLDLSDKLLKKTLTRLKKSSFKDFKLYEADALHLPFEAESFDVVICNLALHFIPDYKLAVQEIAKVLKPGGIFVGCNPVTGLHEKYDRKWERIGKKSYKSGISFSEKDFQKACKMYGLSYERSGLNGIVIYFRSLKQ
ncbi:MAG: methyltransferase domain-containing protein [Halanaerobiales bacterium]|nr:methyltransferase domain-containing protein [Halanaerobiales bacterium]